jgi:two-component system sensor histidine kinase UhpB
MPEKERLSQLLLAHLHRRETEAARVSRVLHDDVGQTLSAAGLLLDALRMDFAPQAPGLGERTGEIQAILEEAITHLREVSFELNPNLVERTGLQFALDKLIGRFRLQSKLPIRLLYQSTAPLENRIATAIYRIIERALENAVQHSRASQIEVRVQATPADLLAEVKDNGRGFDASAPRGSGLGLMVMEHYAREVGITLSIKTSPGQGTMIEVYHLKQEGPR